MAGLVAGYGIAVPVGAVGAYLVTLTARTCLLVGVCAALGVATADLLYAAAAVTGGGAAAGAVRPAAPAMELGFGLVLLALALSTAVRALRARRAAPDALRAAEPAAVLSPPRAYAGLLGITLLNPTTVVYFTALVVGGAAASLDGPAEGTAFVLAAFAASASWQLLLVGGGSVLGRAVSGPRGQLLTALAASLVIGAQAVALLA
nr:LysE family transporter [Motilibacter deserti]